MGPLGKIPKSPESHQCYPTLDEIAHLIELQLFKQLPWTQVKITNHFCSTIIITLSGNQAKHRGLVHAWHYTLCMGISMCTVYVGWFINCGLLTIPQ